LGVPKRVKIASAVLITLLGLGIAYGLYNYFINQNNNPPNNNHSPTPTPTPSPSPTHSPPPKNLTDQILDQSELARNLFNADESAWENVVRVASTNGSDIPKNLAYQVLRQIEGDDRVADKPALAREVFQLYVDCAEKVQRMSQIYALNNATDYFRNSTALRNEIGNEVLITALEKLGENDGINIDFDAARKHANMFRLAKYVSNILDYPKDWRECAIQVDDIIYKTCKVDSGNENETDAWTSAVRPAVKYMVDKLDTGEAKYDFGIPDKFLEAQVRRQRILPLQLFQVNITSGEFPERLSVSFVGDVEMGKYNVSPNPNLGGKSPQQWLEDLAKKDFNEKTPRYQLSLPFGRGGSYMGVVAYPDVFWPASYEALKEAVNTVLAEDPTAVYIIGYSRALASGYIPWGLEPVVPMWGQTTPYYADLIARAFGRAAFVVRDVYPPVAGGGSHDEPYVVISPELYGKLSQKGETLLPYMFGGWPYKAALKADHDNKDLGVRTYNPRIIWSDGTEEEIKL